MRLIDADEIDFHYLPLRAVLKDLYITKSEVDKMPTVEAEPIRHGKWLFVVGNNTQEIWMCDQCKRSILIKPMEKDELIKKLVKEIKDAR